MMGPPWKSCCSFVTMAPKEKKPKTVAVINCIFYFTTITHFYIQMKVVFSSGLFSLNTVTMMRFFLVAGLHSRPHHPTVVRTQLGQSLGRTGLLGFLPANSLIRSSHLTFMVVLQWEQGPAGEVKNCTMWLSLFWFCLVSPEGKVESSWLSPGQWWRLALSRRDVCLPQYLVDLLPFVSFVSLNKCFFEYKHSVNGR